MRTAAFSGLALCLTLSAVATAAPAPPPPANTVVAAPKTLTAKAVKPAVPSDWTGNWTGSVAQVGRAAPYTIDITLAGKTGQTNYPDQHCAGKLVRVGTSGDYEFFVETIADGKFDPTTKAGCLDGTLTLQKNDGGLVMAWMTSFGGKAVIAYGTLDSSKK